MSQDKEQKKVRCVLVESEARFKERPCSISNAVAILPYPVLHRRSFKVFVQGKRELRLITNALLTIPIPGLS